MRPADRRDVGGVGDLPAGEVGVAEVADLALGHQLVEGGQGLLDRGHRVRGVQLVQVDVVGLQPGEGLLHRDLDVAAAALGAGRRAVAHVGALVPELGGEHHLVPAALQDLAERELGRARPAVGLGGVEERDALVDGGVDDRAGLLGHRDGRRSYCSRGLPPRRAGRSHPRFHSAWFRIIRPGRPAGTLSGQSGDTAKYLTQLLANAGIVSFTGAHRGGIHCLFATQFHPRGNPPAAGRAERRGRRGPLAEERPLCMHNPAASVRAQRVWRLRRDRHRSLAETACAGRQ